MLLTYLIIKRIGMANLRLDQATTLLLTFSYPNFIMSKRFESGTSKRKRKKIENDDVKKIKPIIAFLHQPLTEATDAGSEVGALTPAQENQCDKADQPTASIQSEESLMKKQCRTLNSNWGMRKQPCPGKMKIQIYFRTQLMHREGKETHESSRDGQNFQFTPGEVNQS